MHRDVNMYKHVWKAMHMIYMYTASGPNRAAFTKNMIIQCSNTITVNMSAKQGQKKNIKNLSLFMFVLLSPFREASQNGTPPTWMNNK